MEKKNKTIKRIIALSGVVVLAGIYIATVIAAITTSAAAPGLFKACVYATFLVPIYMYVCLLLHKWVVKRAEENKYKGPEE